MRWLVAGLLTLGCGSVSTDGGSEGNGESTGSSGTGSQGSGGTTDGGSSTCGNGVVEAGEFCYRAVAYDDVLIGFLGDLNGDGRTDVINGTDGLRITGPDGELGPLLGWPEGPDSAQGTYATAADLDGDGIDDFLIALQSDDAPDARTIDFYFGRPDGLPVYEQRFVFGETGPTLGPILAGDIDRDEDLDVVMVLKSDDMVLSALNDGTGTLVDGPVSALAPTSMGDQDSRRALADVDGDGWPDLFYGDIVTDSGDSGLAITYGDGAGGFEGLTLAQVAAGRGSGGLGDLGGDGRADLVTQGPSGLEFPRYDELLYFRSTGRELADHISIHPPGPDEGDMPPVFALADVDLDGVLDVALGVNPHPWATPVPMHVLLSRPQQETFDHLGNLALEIDRDCENPLDTYSVDKMEAAYFNGDEVPDFFAHVQAICTATDESAHALFMILSDP
jgi:hypothetical protein